VPTCPRVVGREHAADERNERETAGAVVTQRIDIPPRVAAWAYRAIEA
jgi:hypothetical protein